MRAPRSSLCLDCHKDIAADVREHHGYHGRMSNAGVGECRACHTEHKGRDADIVQLGRAQFDHRLTDFALEGAHCGARVRQLPQAARGLAQGAGDLRRLPQSR